MMKFKYPCCFSYIAKFAFLVGLNGILLEMLQLKMCSFLNSWSNWKSVNFAHFLKLKWENFYITHQIPKNKSLSVYFYSNL